ncbi:MAG: hypothetical protein RLZZ86_191 [Cyanobacteriota bacterium]|jgi:hypothetical protein
MINSVFTIKDLVFKYEQISEVPSVFTPEDYMVMVELIPYEPSLPTLNHPLCKSMVSTVKQLQQLFFNNKVPIDVVQNLAETLDKLIEEIDMDYNY